MSCDARTRVEHLVLEESAAAHRRAGRYLARCGVEVMAASLTEPGRGPLSGVCAVSSGRQAVPDDLAHEVQVFAELLP